MLLTITTTAPPATDLGFLLHKHPEKVQRFEQAYGTAHVFYPEAGRTGAPRRCCWRSIRSGWCARKAGVRPPSRSGST